MCGVSNCKSDLGVWCDDGVWSAVIIKEYFAKKIIAYQKARGSCSPKEDLVLWFAMIRSAERNLYCSLR